MTVVMATTLCWICIFSLILWAHMAANGCNDVPDYVYDDCESRIGLPVDNESCRCFYVLFISPQVYRPDEPAYEDLNSLVQQAQRRLQPLSHEQIVVVDNFYNDPYKVRRFAMPTT